MKLIDLFASGQSLQTCGVLKNSIDRHSHILYAVDDGIKSSKEALSVLDFEASLGVRTLWCTPHIMEDVPNTTEALRLRFEELCALYNGPVKLHLAAEYMIDTLFEQRLKASDLLTMEDDMVLMEASTVTPPYDMDASLSAAMAEGYRPLLAHPERYRYLEMKDFGRLVQMGVRLQLNLASLTGYYGNTAKNKAEALLKAGMYFAYGSDCHRFRVMQEQYARPISRGIVRKLSGIQ